ncbi:unnamed product [Ostreococcus tauri]|uniref:Unnamed product n=1 Tax=Ostreococcus tauri TaxID=70448 RepID=A0A090M4K6_OSTTA|nr:unnamed product [Ostreococcus tauri]CEF96919.1 unnamed product [Ostreococcus tauri]|eukprot:XP_022838379.1 unnamed product [Ostreococcus tauri]
MVIVREATTTPSIVSSSTDVADDVRTIAAAHVASCDRPHRVLANVGSSSWREVRRATRRIRDAAHAEAVSNAIGRDEHFVLSTISGSDVLSEALTMELLRAEAWRADVLPRAMRRAPETFATNPVLVYAVYLALHQECVMCNILSSLCTSRGNGRRLCDYCQRALARLAGDTPALLDADTDSLEFRIREIEFVLSMSALGVLRGITEAMDDLALSVRSRLLDSRDVSSALVTILDTRPWTRRRRDGVLQLYVDGVWREVSKSEEWDVACRVSKCEAQAWLALRALMCDAQFSWDDRRVAAATKLRRRLNESTIDQIPVLMELASIIDRAAGLDAPPPANARGFVLEVIPSLRARVIAGGSELFEDAAKKMLEEHFNPNDSDFATRVAEEAIDIASGVSNEEAPIEDITAHTRSVVRIDVLRERRSLSSSEVSFDAILAIECYFTDDEPSEVHTKTSKTRALRRRLRFDDDARNTSLSPFDGKIRVAMDARTVAAPVRLRAGPDPRAWITVGSVQIDGFALQLRLDADRDRSSAAYRVADAYISIAAPR